MISASVQNLPVSPEDMLPSTATSSWVKHCGNSKDATPDGSVCVKKLIPNSNEPRTITNNIMDRQVEPCETSIHTVLPYAAIHSVSTEEKKTVLNELISDVNWGLIKGALKNSSFKIKLLNLQECSNDLMAAHRINELYCVLSASLKIIRYKNHPSIYEDIRKYYERINFIWHYYFNCVVIPFGEASVYYPTEKEMLTICSKRFGYLLPQFMKSEFLGGNWFGSASNETTLCISPNNEKSLKVTYYYPVCPQSIPVRIKRSNDNFLSMPCGYESLFEKDFKKCETINFECEGRKLGKLTGKKAQRFAEFLLLGSNLIKEKSFRRQLTTLCCWHFVQYIHSGCTDTYARYSAPSRESLPELKDKLNAVDFFQPLFFYTDNKVIHAAFYLGAGLVISVTTESIMFNKLDALVSAYEKGMRKEISIGICNTPEIPAEMV